VGSEMCIRDSKQSYEEEIIDAEVIDGAAEESGEYQDNSQGTEEVHPTE
jgi:hypothetical protein